MLDTYHFTANCTVIVFRFIIRFVVFNIGLWLALRTCDGVVDYIVFYVFHEFFYKTARDRWCVGFRVDYTLETEIWVVPEEWIELWGVFFAISTIYHSGKKRLILYFRYCWHLRWLLKILICFNFRRFDTWSLAYFRLNLKNSSQFLSADSSFTDGHYIWWFYESHIHIFDFKYVYSFMVDKIEMP